MREAKLQEIIEELSFPAEIKKAPSNITYILLGVITNNEGKITAVTARRKKTDGSLGFWTSLKLTDKFYIDYGK